MTRRQRYIMDRWRAGANRHEIASEVGCSAQTVTSCLHVLRQQGYDVPLWDAHLQGEGPNPSGLCQCGCGERVPLATRGSTERGWVKGKPVRFVSGHGGRGKRRQGPDYVVDGGTGCWVWQHSVAKGYGRIFHNGRWSLAHRVYYEEAKGPVPEGLELDHLCRNRSCVNPDHLEAVTRLVNVRRGAVVRFTEDEVRAIRADSRTYVEIARSYGCSKGAIGAIKGGRTWRDLLVAA